MLNWLQPNVQACTSTQGDRYEYISKAKMSLPTASLIVDAEVGSKMYYIADRTILISRYLRYLVVKAFHET